MIYLTCPGFVEMFAADPPDPLRQSGGRFEFGNCGGARPARGAPNTAFGESIWGKSGLNM